MYDNCQILYYSTLIHRANRSVMYTLVLNQKHLSMVGFVMILCVEESSSKSSWKMTLKKKLSTRLTLASLLGKQNSRFSVAQLCPDYTRLTIQTNNFSVINLELVSSLKNLHILRFFTVFKDLLFLQ